MAEFEAPTFSLGFDFGFDSEPQTPLRDDSTCNPASTAAATTTTTSTPGNDVVAVDDNDDDNGNELFGLEVADSEPEPVEEVESNRILKRLRRGGRVDLNPESGSKKEPVDDNDDIEDFSSPEDLRRGDETLSAKQSSLCSGSKFPQHAYRVLSTQTTSQSKSRERKQSSCDPAWASLGVTANKIEFPKLTISPLRRFQLLDSDSDHDDLFYDNVTRIPKVDTTTREGIPVSGNNSATSEKRKMTSATVPPNVDLWKKLSPVKSFCIPTPALDEVCEEYFRFSKENTVPQKAVPGVLNMNDFCENTYRSQNIELNQGTPGTRPPAHRYFCHEDPRIQNLVRCRLSNFFPLGVVNQRANTSGASVIDYMGQFCHGETSKKRATQSAFVGRTLTKGSKKSKKPSTSQSAFVGRTSTKGSKKSKKPSASQDLEASGSWVNPSTSQSAFVGRTSTKGSKKSKKPSASQDLEASGSWVNPKTHTATPKDAGRRRVRADGQSDTGHWITTGNQKVYVSKNGSRYTSTAAYRQYKKDMKG